MRVRTKTDTHPTRVPQSPVQPAPLRWFDGADRRFTVRGLGWFGETGGRFHRLPPRAQGQAPESVWYLSQCPASAHLAFRTDTTRLSVRATNRDTALMDHMPATGTLGFALFGGPPDRMRPWTVSRRDPTSPSFECVLLTGLPKEMREFRLYLPLYKPMDALEIGLDRDARILRPSPLRLDKPIVFYGTSITQGGCASTAGSDFVSRVGRLLNVETVNLGFSGSGRGEPVMARLISELDAALFVLDYAANAGGPEAFRRTLPRFFSIIRKAHPTTPILLAGHVCFWAYDWSTQTRATLEGCRDVLLDFYVRQRKRGDAHVHVVDGFGLIPFGSEGAYCDGVHPSDHGFQLMAERLAPVLSSILFRNG